MGANDRILISIGADGISIDAPRAQLDVAAPVRIAGASIPLPRSDWTEQGGTCGGLVVPRDGASPYYLVAALVPEARIEPAKFGKLEALAGVSSPWDGQANMRALLAADPENVIANRIKALHVGGHADWFWPSRLDSAVLYANVGDMVREFLGAWGAWICEQHPDFPSIAYVQTFDSGNQGWGHKGNEFGAVAVRRVYPVL
ncbi:hypothetical protein [Burkholderia sp. BCC1985]|uniref:hypothetical protein n=1 Tax=Burkholderia sp. BCC1985 TaxID=2817442 RepID=UPI002AAFC2A5|nr:hypothetical protein [Burkholderia sp. BCC1985]